MEFLSYKEKIGAGIILYKEDIDMRKFRKCAGIMCVLFLFAFIVPCNVFGAAGAGAAAGTAATTTGTAAGTAAAAGIATGTIVAGVAVAAVAAIAVANAVNNDDVTPAHH